MDPRLLSVSWVLVVCAGGGPATVQLALYAATNGADTIGSSSAGASCHRPGFLLCSSIGFRHCVWAPHHDMVVHRDRLGTGARDTTA